MEHDRKYISLGRSNVRPKCRPRAGGISGIFLPHRDARTARGFGAEGIGLCRTEHMFFEEDRIAAVREMILADDEKGRRAQAEIDRSCQQAEDSRAGGAAGSARLGCDAASAAPDKVRYNAAVCYNAAVDADGVHGIRCP